MKKGIQESNPILALWQGILLDGRIHGLAIDCRRKTEIPDNGFNTSGEFDTWLKKFDNKKSNLILESNTKLFIEKMKEIIPYHGIISERSFRVLMIRFLSHNKIEDEYLGLFSGQENVNIIKNGKTYNKYGKEFIGDVEDGIYIKIGPFSTMDKIKKFIENNKSLIREKQEFYIKKEKLKKPKKMKLSSNFERNKLIIDLNDSFSNEQIAKSFGINKEKYKDMTISSLMRIIGYKNVSSSVVKAIKQRRKIK